MADERPYAARLIRHVIPKDGVDHELEDCVCRPAIHVDAYVLAAGLDELGVKGSGEAGSLTFVHSKLAETSEYEFVDEEAVWEDVDE